MPTATADKPPLRVQPATGRAIWVSEPPARWQVRQPLVVDCSVVVAWLFEEPEGQEAVQTLSGRALHAPTLLPYEVANVARSKRRAGAPAESVVRVLEDFQAQSLDIGWHKPPAPAVLALAERYNLSSYDAAYLWVAAELKAPLAPLDRRLADAARQLLSDL